MEKIDTGAERRDVRWVERERTVAVRESVGWAAAGLECSGTAEEACGGEGVRKHAAA